MPRNDDGTWTGETGDGGYLLSPINDAANPGVVLSIRGRCQADALGAETSFLGAAHTTLTHQQLMDFCIDLGAIIGHLADIPGRKERARLGGPRKE